MTTDPTNAERQRRYRERQAGRLAPAQPSFCSRLRPWRAVFADGSTAGMLATSRTQALLTARELMPGFVRLEQEGDW